MKELSNRELNLLIRGVDSRTNELRTCLESSFKNQFWTDDQLENMRLEKRGLNVLRGKLQRRVVRVITEDNGK